MLKKCKTCKSKFTFTDDNMKFIGAGCTEHGVILYMKKLDSTDTIELKEKVIETLPCETKINIEEQIVNMEVKPDKETMIRFVRTAYEQGVKDGQK